jgi:hypothetical protein
MVSSDTLGQETEEEYAKVLDAVIVGGLRDCGKDLVVAGIGCVQVKCTIARAYAFLQKSIQHCRFIPLCVGEPGTADEIRKDLKEFGVWLGKDIVNRTAIQVAVAKIRAEIIAKNTSRR